MSTKLTRRDFLRQSSQHAALAAGGMAAASSIIASQPTGAAADGVFQAGWATVSITPDRPVQLAGQFHERVSNSVLYPCLATALALEGKDASGGKEQAIMIACDVVNVGREETEAIRASVAAQLPDFDTRKLFINATHTHTGPTLAKGVYKDPDPGVMGPREYVPFFCERVAEAAIQGWANKHPATLSRAVGHAAVGFCRIAVYADGSSQMYGKSDRPDFVGLEGGHDHGLELLFLWDAAEQLSGIAINIACPSQVVEGQLYVCSDFWGPVREELKARYGEQVSVYPMTGAAGDQSPRDLIRRGRGEPDMRSEPGMREMARRIVNGVAYALETAQTARNADPVFRHHVESLDLPVRQVTDEEYTEARKELEKLLASGDVQPGSRDAAMVRRARNVVECYEKQDAESVYTMDLHVMRLGDVAIATNPFELYLEYGLQIKARSNAAQTFLSQLTNDRGRYLPTRRAVAGGAYGSRITDNRVGPEGGDALVARTLDIIARLWE
ncbi:MAG TPA: hypothetical protein ENN29_08355 [Candidatus Hydrogenedentes bacterium]|nr:hypothetical protein [Candidatus Hydrogenedentota bacterium]